MENGLRHASGPVRHQHFRYIKSWGVFQIAKYDKQRIFVVQVYPDKIHDLCYLEENILTAKANSISKLVHFGFRKLKILGITSDK